MNEIFYIAEQGFLERYLKERASTPISDMKEIHTFFGCEKAPDPGSDDAVNKIYSIIDGNAHIKINGALSPEGPDAWDLFWGYGGASYKTIQAAMERAKIDPGVHKVILDIDSPGGTLAGADETWQSHKALAAVKPTEVHSGNTLASGAYYISTPAKKILATAPTNRIGSIGVLVATYDWSKWEENEGIKEVVITSSNAPDKHPDIATEGGKETIRKQLDAMERIFYSRISEGRGVSNEHIAKHFGKGGILCAKDPSKEHEDAIRAGMIDGMCNDTSVYQDNSDESVFTELSKDELKELLDAIEYTNFDVKEASALADKNTPATAGNTQEGQIMDLSELLKQNPAAAAEIEKLKNEAKVAGAAEVKAELTATVERVMPIITSSAYPSNIKALAGDVIAGKKNIDAFDAAIAIYDSGKEAGASGDAQSQTQELGAVVADMPSLTPAVEKELDAAIKAELDKRKAK